MLKRHLSPCSIAAYFAFFWGLGWGLASFSFEGWGMSEISNLFHTPIGWVSISLIVLAIGLFCFRFFVKILSPYEFAEERDARRPELARLKDELREYFRCVNLLSRKGELYDTTSHQDGLRERINFLNQLQHNTEFVKLKLDDDSINSLTESIYIIASSLSNNHLKKLLDKAFKAEVKAKSQQIAIRSYRINFTHTDATENKLLSAEDTQEPNFVRAFGKSLRNLYGYIKAMEKGIDIDEVQILPVRKRH